MLTLQKENPEKARWISAASISFMLGKGYLIEDNDTYLTMEFPDLSPLKFLIEQYPSNEIFVFNQVFVEDCYGIVSQTLSENDRIEPVIVEVGEHPGFSTMYFIQRYPNATIRCLSQNDQSRMTENLNINNLNHHIHQSLGRDTKIDFVNLHFGAENVAGLRMLLDRATMIGIQKNKPELMVIANELEKEGLFKVSDTDDFVLYNRIAS